MAQWTREDPGAGDMDGLLKAAAGLRTLAAEVDGDTRTAVGAVRGVDGQWSGQAADAFTSAVDRVPKVTRFPIKAMGTVERAITTYANEVGEIKQRAAHERAVLDDARATIANVTSSPLPVLGGVVGVVAGATVLELAQRDLKGAEGALDSLAQARQAADGRLAAAIADARSDLSACRSQHGAFFAKFGVGLADGTFVKGGGPVREQDLPVGKSAEEVRKWWEEHAADREDLMRRFPEILGNLDGIPAEDRDEMNRARLPVEREKWNDEYEKARQRLLELGIDPDDPNFRSYYLSADQITAMNDMDRAKAKVDSMDTLAQTIAKGDDRYLLLLDNSAGQTKAAVACGNPDTAANVAVMTGGVSTTVNGRWENGHWVSGMDRMASHADNIRNECRDQFGSSDVSVVAWMGYEAPAGLDDPLAWTDARANTGGKALTSFSSGIIATHNGDPHLTLLGHSYGSTVTGIAASHAQGIDDVVVYGSPGVGRAAVNVPEGHAYAMRNPDDPIHWASRVSQGWSHGRDPIDDPAFQNLATIATEETTRTKGHDYYTPGTTSMQNIAAVVSGHNDRVIKRPFAERFLDEAS